MASGKRSRTTTQSSMTRSAGHGSTAGMRRSLVYVNHGPRLEALRALWPLGGKGRTRKCVYNTGQLLTKRRLGRAQARVTPEAQKTHVLDLGGKSEMKPSGRLCSVYFASLIPTTSLLPWDGKEQCKRTQPFFCSVATAGQSPSRSAAQRGCTLGEENSLDPGAHVGQDVAFGIALPTFPPSGDRSGSAKRWSGARVFDPSGLLGFSRFRASLSGSAPLQSTWQPTEGRYGRPLPLPGHQDTPYPIGLV